MAFWQWSRTAANNASAAPAINWREGQSPSSVNDSARAVMAEAAAYRDDISGSIATGGTSTAYTLTSFQIFDTLAHMDKAMIGFVPHTTNGTSPTLSVDGLAARPIRSAPSTDIGSGVLVQGTPYFVTFNNSDSVFYLHSLYGNPFQTPLGGLLPYVGTTAPNTNFVLPFGQAISRTTYATLFALTGTTFGVGDGSTTFNVLDVRGSVIAGVDNMGGATRGLITNAGCGITGTTLGASGGAESITLDATMIPSHTHPSPSVTIPDHNHFMGVHNASNNTQFPGNKYLGPNTPGLLYSNSKDGANNLAVDAISTTSLVPAVSSTTGSTGGGAAHRNVQPTIMLNWILRVL